MNPKIPGGKLTAELIATEPSLPEYGLSELPTNRIAGPRNAYVKQLSLLVVRFEVFTAVTMKNVVFWDMKTQFVPHRRHITSPLKSPAG
jgi:hypothetical protein